MSYEIENCRVCESSELNPIMSLGNQYVTNFVNSEQEQGEKIPLDLVLCGDCNLLQLRHSAPPESTWNDQYWYKSGISSTIRNDLSDIVKKAQQIRKLNPQNTVIDIGCNDGTLLDSYGNSIKRIGFEPSENVAEEAASKGHFVVNDFFNYEAFKNTAGNERAKIITAISMFYDLDNPNEFLRDINKSLDDNGLFVIQQNYLVTMLQQNAFDNICHEHREYYSLNSLERLLVRHGLEVFDAEQNDVNGGSIRTYIKRRGSNLQGLSAGKKLDKIRNYEESLKLDMQKPYLEFAERISKIKTQLLNFLNKQKKSGKSIGIYGASTRGNVALQYFGLNPKTIDFATDKNPDKWGKKTVGSYIPIISPEEMRKRNPDYLLVNTWHFFDEIKEQERDYHDRGGKFVVALPQFKVE